MGRRIYWSILASSSPGPSNRWGRPPEEWKQTPWHAWETAFQKVEDNEKGYYLFILGSNAEARFGEVDPIDPSWIKDQQQVFFDGLKEKTVWWYGCYYFPVARRTGSQEDGPARLKLPEDRLLAFLILPSISSSIMRPFVNWEAHCLAIQLRKAIFDTLAIIYARRRGWLAQFYMVNIGKHSVVVHSHIIWSQRLPPLIARYVSSKM